MCESFINLHFTLRCLYYNLLFPESNVKQLGPGSPKGGCLRLDLTHTLLYSHLYSNFYL